MKRYSTGIAAEFYVLSMLHRLGFDATLTLGNKKAVDIVVALRRGTAVTIDVKGLAGKTSWPVENIHVAKKRHVYVFVSFLGRIDDPSTVPEIYVIPSMRMRSLISRPPSGRKFVELRRLRRTGTKYRDAWHLLQQAAS